MPKVLILGLYYPPANFIAGRRLEGWARHLPAFGYEPLVLTRFYDLEERNGHDFYASSRPTRTLSEPWIKEGSAVYTRFASSYWSRMPLPGRVRGIGHYAWPDPDHAAWFRECYSYLRHSKFKPDIIIASCSPPGVLRIARKLSRLMGIPWVADFRDLWIDEFGSDFGTRLKYFFQRHHLQSAAGITVVADAMVEAMREQLAPIEKPIRLVYSGAEPPTNSGPDATDSKAIDYFQRVRQRYPILLTYAGTLYPEQEIERFLDTVAGFNKQTSDSCGVVLCGTHQREQYAQWPFVEIIEPVGHNTALYLQKESTALFYPTWPQRYSGFSGKIFEQILSGRPVLIAFQPSADLESLCQRFVSLIITREPEDLIGVLKQLPSMTTRFQNGEVPAIATRRYWTGELAHFLDEILDGEKSAAH